MHTMRRRLRLFPIHERPEIIWISSPLYRFFQKEHVQVVRVLCAQRSDCAYNCRMLMHCSSPLKSNVSKGFLPTFLMPAFDCIVPPRSIEIPPHPFQATSMKLPRHSPPPFRKDEKGRKEQSQELSPINTQRPPSAYGKRKTQDSQKRQGQIAINLSLQLDLDIQIQLEAQLQAILIHHLALPLAARRLQLLFRISRPHGDLASHCAGIGDGSIHGGAVGPDPLEGLHAVVLLLGLLGGQGALGLGGGLDGCCLLRGRLGFGSAFGHGGHGLLLFLRLRLLLAAGTTGLRAGAVARVGFFRVGDGCLAGFFGGLFGGGHDCILLAGR